MGSGRRRPLIPVVLAIAVGIAFAVGMGGRDDLGFLAGMNPMRGVAGPSAARAMPMLTSQRRVGLYVFPAGKKQELLGRLEVALTRERGWYRFDSFKDSPVVYVQGQRTGVVFVPGSRLASLAEGSGLSLNRDRSYCGLLIYREPTWLEDKWAMLKNALGIS